jgi:hypothetical protein
VRAVKKTRKPKTEKATTIKAAHPQAKVAVDQTAPVADRALVKACPVALVVDRAEAKECPEATVVVNLVKARAEAPVVVNLVKARAEAPAVVNSNPRS